MFGMGIGKVALYFITRGNAVLEASVNLYTEYLTKESREGFGDFKIQGQVIPCKPFLFYFTKSWSYYTHCYYSGPCYKHQMQPLSRTSGTPFVHKPHSIRLVEIPPTSDGQCGIKLSVESAQGLPVSS